MIHIEFANPVQQWRATPGMSLLAFGQRVYGELSVLPLVVE